MAVFIEPLFEKEEIVGSVFISYSRKDEEFVKSIIEPSLCANNIPYFLDKKDILVGKPVDEIYRGLKNATCAIVIISKNSMSSPWIFYEIGLIIGMKKTIIPYILEIDNTKKFIETIPDFIKQYNILSTTKSLINAVHTKMFLSQELAKDTEIDNSVIEYLRQVKIYQIFNIPKDIKPYIKFGYLLVKFGQNIALEQVTDEFAKKHGNLLLKTIKPLRSVKRNPKMYQNAV